MFNLSVKFSACETIVFILLTLEISIYNIFWKESVNATIKARYQKQKRKGKLQKDTKSSFRFPKITFDQN